MGPKGYTGEAGEMGPIGYTGEMGPRGYTGEMGPRDYVSINYYSALVVFTTEKTIY